MTAENIPLTLVKSDVLARECPRPRQADPSDAGDEVTTETESAEPFTARAGEHIDRACQRAWTTAVAENRSFDFLFNGIAVHASPDVRPPHVIEVWNQAMQMQHDAYWTPDRIRERDIEHEQHRETMAALMAEMRTLPMDHMPALIRWLCRIESAAFIHAPVAATAVLSHFGDAGYGVNVLLSGADETTEQWSARVGPDGEMRWLIGQALHCIKTVGAPHGMIHAFAERFGVA